MRLTGAGRGSYRPIQAGSLAIWSAAFADHDTTPVAVTAIGDSITAGLGASDTAHRYTDKLEDLMDAAYGVGDVVVRTNGAPGQQSSYFTNPANYTLGTSPTPSLVILELGINDMVNGTSVASYKANMLDIIGDVRSTLATDPTFLLLAIYGIGDGYPRQWDDYVDAMYQIGGADGDVVVLDLRPVFGSPSTAKLDPDLVHPNDTGHLLVAQTIFDYIT